ncbi:hypothetical protein M3Y99_01844800 [Aphelenchoides fujianensis]|nr:hypothetical protein M3Y99_01844800 [Aphelenchoides fujianensis]
MSDLRLRIKLLRATLEYIMFESDISHNTFIYETAIHAEYKATRNEELSEELRAIGKSLATFVKEQFPEKFHYMKDRRRALLPEHGHHSASRRSLRGRRAPSSSRSSPRRVSERLSSSHVEGNRLDSIGCGLSGHSRADGRAAAADYGIEELDLDHYRTPSQTPPPPPLFEEDGGEWTGLDGDRDDRSFVQAFVDSAITDQVQNLMSGNSRGNSRTEQPPAPFGSAEWKGAAAASRPVVQQPPPNEHKFDNNNAPGPWKQQQSKQDVRQQPARSEVEDMAELFDGMPQRPLERRRPPTDCCARRRTNEENIRGPLVSFGTPTPNASPRAPSTRQSPARFVQTPPDGVSRPQARRPDSVVVPPPDFSALERSTSAASSVHSNTARAGVARESPPGRRSRPPPPRRRRAPAQVQRPVLRSSKPCSSGSRGHRQREAHVDNSQAAFVQSARSEKIFYTVLRGSITNSAEVNEYRENYWRDPFTDLERYAPMPEILKQFESAEHGESLAPMIEVLQQLEWMFRDGMTQQEFLKMNRLLQQKGRLPFVGARQEVMSLIDCLETKLISQQGERYFVHPDIAAIQLWRIPLGLTSNMLRMLLNEKSLLVQEISRQNGLLLDSFGRTVVVQDFDVVRQANCWPTLFFIRAEASEQQSMGTATISVYTDVPKWKLLLDSPIETNVPMTCDCDECTNGQPPCIVPELN